MSEPPTVPSGQTESAADMDVTDAIRAETAAAAQSGGTGPDGGETSAPEAAVPSDAELITATRAGDGEAFGTLYARHVDNARRLARSMVNNPADVDDLVAESFAKVLAALRSGRGPDLAMRAYLLTTLRHTCYDRARRDRRVELAGDMSDHDTGEAFVDPAVEGLERRYAARAFAKLPERWRLVLWHTAVEGESPADVAPLLGLTPNGVSALAYRARERLRQLYLKEHINETASSCHWAAERLGAHVRDALAPRDVAKVQAHLDDCERCRVLYVELAEVNANLRGVLAWVVLGTTAPAYLGVAAHKGVLTAAAGGGLLGWWSGKVGATANGVRSGIQKVGPRNTAIGGGAVAAVAATILVAMLVSSPQRPPAPPAGAAPSAQPAVPPANQPPANQPPPAPQPTTPGAPPEQPRRPGASPPVNLPVPPVPAPVPVPVRQPFVITPQQPDGGGMTAGSVSELPIVVRAVATEQADGSESPRTAGGRRGRAVAFVPAPGHPEGHERFRMEVTLPAGIRLSGVAGRGGWTCAPRTGGASCSRRQLDPGESTTVRLPVLIDPRLHGRHQVTVSVTDGRQRATSTFSVTIAPFTTQPKPPPPRAPERGDDKPGKEHGDRGKGHHRDRDHHGDRGPLRRLWSLLTAPW